MTSTKDMHYILVLYGILLGSIVGATVWLFLVTINIGIHFIWEYLPTIFASPPYYTICVTTIGGILVGLTQKYFGTYPRLMPEVMSEYKKTGRIEYRFVHKATLTAIIVLIFGASLGPEAALVGIIGGLCTWVGDRFTFALKGMNELTEVGIGATLSVIFNAPLFGYLAPNENEGDQINEFSKGKKAIVYLATTFAGFSIYLLLSKFDNRGSFIVDFGEGSLSLNEWIAFLPLASIGAIVGFFYFKLEFTLEKLIHPLKEYKLALGIIGGILLGITGTFLPYTLFSGEHQLKDLVLEWSHLSFWVLLLSGILKLCITAVCLNTGWRGGHIFPIIFAGSSIGYAIASIIPIDPIASVAIVTTAISSYALRKPIAITLLLLMFFPLNLLLPMLGAAAIGNAFPLPKNNKAINE
ncbi:MULTISPECIES: chloride channel protein [Bacillus]|uniref:Chloride channel protein n=2 Tax=Bacillus cereus group TaxID=86661 RepID=A0A2A7D512_BACAN|nr:MULTISPECIES: chloride channel protein [Bacillus]MCP1166483.1 chloride channel protein [Bacillus sp. 1813sda1]MDC7974357.1 chloride channel protein [Bacillus sp. BLCC-B18]OTW69611.1 chloride channel protein [Bacillus thuringiensis serovar coreanensis]OTX45808.1 chloride channel protein [Bacillus thuringiensis serovar sooncheon]OTX48579.1 chloride channel protein [Bacillus thuringiensis serovar guiyangiensis]